VSVSSAGLRRARAGGEDDSSRGNMGGSGVIWGSPVGHGPLCGEAPRAVLLRLSLLLTSRLVWVAFLLSALA